MTELDLYKFITINNIEWHFENDDKELDVFICIYYELFSEFCEMISSFLDYREEPKSALIKNGYVVFQMREICEYYEIEMKNVFEEQK